MTAPLTCVIRHRPLYAKGCQPLFAQRLYCAVRARKGGEVKMMYTVMGVLYVLLGTVCIVNGLYH